MKVRVRAESPRDVADIHDVTVAAFGNAPHGDRTEQFIVDALRASGQLSVSLVAEHDGRIIGHVALSPVSISDGTAHWYGLGPISVLPEHQGRGVGTRLMERALGDLCELGARGCVVLGDPGYYARFGFRAVASLALPGVPPEYFQALAFRDPPPCGIVAYHASFAARG